MPALLRARYHALVPSHMPLIQLTTIAPQGVAGEMNNLTVVAADTAGQFFSGNASELLDVSIVAVFVNGTHVRLGTDAPSDGIEMVDQGVFALDWSATRTTFRGQPLMYRIDVAAATAGKAWTLCSSSMLQA